MGKHITAEKIRAIHRSITLMCCRFLYNSFFATSSGTDRTHAGKVTDINSCRQHSAMEFEPKTAVAAHKCYSSCYTFVSFVLNGRESFTNKSSSIVQIAADNADKLILLVSGINSRLLSVNHTLISPILIHPVLWVALPPSVPPTHRSHHPSPLTHSFQA